MGTVKILDHTGHTTIDSTLERERAKEEFDRHQQMGMKAFDLKTKEPMKEFDPDADALLVSPLVGG